MERQQIRGVNGHNPTVVSAEGDNLGGCENRPGALDSAGEVVSVDEVAQMGSQLIVSFIEVACRAQLRYRLQRPWELAQQEARLSRPQFGKEENF
jgi:hypothetical protein